MTVREHILEVLNTMPPAEAIKLIESIGKQIRRENSVRISILIDNLRLMTKNSG